MSDPLIETVDIGANKYPATVLIDPDTGEPYAAGGAGGGSGTEYTEGATDATITGQAILWEDADDTLSTVSAAAPLPVNIVSGSSSGTEYTEGATDATITGQAMLWEDSADTLRTVSAAKPLPVDIVGGSSAGTEYAEGDTDASITGQAILWEDAGDTLRPVSASKPLPSSVLSVVPGTAATSLGKAADSAAGATDTGVAVLAVRDDALAALTPVEGDYVPLRVDSTGALHVTGATVGGATEAEQSLQTTELQDINTKLAAIDDLLDGLEGGFTTLNATDFATEAKQDTGNTHVSKLTSSATNITPGAALATTSLMVGARHLATPPTFTDGQEGGLQVDSAGRLLVTDDGIGGASGTEYTEGDTEAAPRAGGVIIWPSSADELYVAGENSPLPVTDSNAFTILGSIQTATENTATALSGVASSGNQDDHTALLTTIDADTGAMALDTAAILAKILTAPATEADQELQTALLTTIDGDTGNIDTKIAAVTGSKAPGTAAASALLAGGVTNTTAPTLTDGQQASLQLTTRGNLISQLYNGAVAITGLGDSTDAVAETASANALKAVIRPFVYNGTTWDRLRGTVLGMWGVIRDAAGNARGANVNASNELNVTYLSNTATTTLTRTSDGNDDDTWAGGPAILYVYGTWGGGTVTFFTSPDAGTTWFAIEDASFTANGMVTLLHLAPCSVRMTLAGATAPSLTGKLLSTR